MTNTAALNQLIRESGLKRSYIAKRLGISTTTLSYKINNRSDFNAREIDILRKLLGFKSLEQCFAIFFVEEVD